MGSKVEQQYKLLNAELMDQVQKQRLEIGEYRKRVISLEREIMDIREEHVLQNHRQQMENISIVRSLMLSLNVDSDSLAAPQEPAQGAQINRPSGPRRSSREICKDMRRTCVLARTTRTISPRRTSSVTSTVSSTSRRSSSEVQSEVEATRVTVDRRANKPTPPPRRPAELVFDEDDSEDDFEQAVSPVDDNNEEAQTDQHEENNRLFSIIEENASEGETTDSSSSCEAIYCDTTVESSPPNGQVTATPSGRALREVDPNVPVAMSLSRGKESGKGSRLTIPAAVDDSPQEPSIQCPRLAVTRPSQSSGIFPEVNGLTPRRSLFNGISQLAGSTSTPKSFLVEEMPSIKTRSRTAANKKSENTDMSSSFCSTSGRPSRSCRPTSLAEPSLRSKMRNGSKSMAKAKK
ncbi:shugoshin isoform X2 [Drosophila teissieri]|uniref:shugoshin isoform X2 n=1 Tax=Drosophila teissieri TaxID=7243 RepID=UPI001CBA1153|nr:shugoshin isoform X2 [Drosophila teissieri]